MKSKKNHEGQGIQYRPVNINSDELRFIASIDVTIPAQFDPRFSVDDSAIERRLEALKKSIKDDLKLRAEEWAKKERLSFLMTNVHVGNKAMQALNESLGFEVEQLTMKRKLGRNCIQQRKTEEPDF